MPKRAYIYSHTRPRAMTKAMTVLGETLIVFGSLQFALALLGIAASTGWTAFAICFVPVAIGGILYFHAVYGTTTPGIKNNGIVQKTVTRRGAWAWLMGTLIVLFYTALYFVPQYLKGAVALVNPLSEIMTGNPADRWFLYGFLYTYFVSLMGIRFYYRYRHNRYQLIRNSSVIAVQLVLAFLVPAFLKALHHPEFYASYFWPLKPNYSFPSYMTDLWNHPGGLGVFFWFWATVLAFIGVPILTYFFGKRWYCSWVCGCGALAETLGDSFRHLSNKSQKAWKFERWSVHLVLVTITLLTVLLWLNHFLGSSLLGSVTKIYDRWYGYIVMSILAGVVGTGFYSLMGNRVWCRFFCPQAAVLGIVQRFFSRFRITTNGDQCMSCGNCSTHCEMGIDVRAYAQRGDNVIRASCVGCGICSAVCPRGVLKLENGKTHKDRFDGADRPLSELLKSLKS